MKSIRAYLSILAVSLAAGCASTNFTEYRGPDMVEGTGGTVKTVDGVDFWENGNPNRKVKILGVIDDERAKWIFSNSPEYPALAKLAKSKGGDAVILMERRSRAVGISQSGNIQHSYSTKVMVVKYID